MDWDEADYPIDCEDYLIEREFRKIKRCHPDPVDLPFPNCMASQNSTFLCSQPILLVIESLSDLTDYLLLPFPSLL